MNMPLPKGFTLEEMWQEFRSGAIPDVAEGSVQLCEMEKAFKSGIIKGGMAFESACDVMPEAQVIDMPRRWKNEYQRFIKLQIVRHPFSTQNESGN